MYCIRFYILANAESADDDDEQDQNKWLKVVSFGKVFIEQRSRSIVYKELTGLDWIPLKEKIHIGYRVVNRLDWAIVNKEWWSSYDCWVYIKTVKNNKKNL